jgi:RNA polymerase sigma factor (sigma-70 family)
MSPARRNGPSAPSRLRVEPNDVAAVAREGIEQLAWSSRLDRRLPRAARHFTTRRLATVEASIAIAVRPVTFVEQAERVLDDAYRLAGYLLGDAFEAQDAVQDALTRSWQAWPTLRDQDRFEPWFDRILVNICRDRLRKRRRVRIEELNDELAVYVDDPFRAALAENEVAGLMHVLNPDQRIVVGLRFWRDLSLQQIADVLGVPLGTVQSRLHYALRALRDEADRVAGAGVLPAQVRR